MKRTIVLLMTGAALIAGCSRGPADDPAAMDAASPAAMSSPSAMTEAQKAYEQVNQTMHAGMSAIPADPDLAYMQGMLAHHKGAIAMSEVVRKFGKDAKARELAGRVIAAQTQEVAEVETWLKARGAAPAAAPAGMTDHESHTP